ncbi:efflux RND transporter periplasmic adaptor subunit [Comamonas sp.]|uniref:efflux RND transporter periplasmic adaptor subunit n=1 Tax=Comamonas sp. TaxID=34028 RepID=UPI002FCA9F6D
MPRHRHLSIAALCTLPLALIACGKTATPDPRTGIPLVRTVEVAPGASSERAFTGIIAARVQSDLGFRVSGKVLERLVDAGQSVKRGQPLLRIDPVDLQLAAQAQDDAVAAATARALQAGEEEARFRDLRGTGAISASAYDQVKAAADSATAQLRAAQAQAQAARNASGYAELRADADGVVVETLVEPGQVVSAGQVVVRLAQGGRREALVQLPETLRPALGSPALASVYGKEDAAVPARLRQLADVADRATRTFEARYVLEGGGAHAPLGSTVTVRIAGRPQSGEAALQVPLSALLDDGNGPAVWLLKGTQVERQRVAIARMDADTAHVTGALRPGDTIVALGAHLLKDGATVRVAAPAPAAPSTGGRSE